MLTTRNVVQVCLTVFLASSCIAIPAFAQDVFDAVPADALFAVRINNFEYTLGQIDQFLTGLAPAPNSAAMMGRMQLANALGDPNLSGINLRGQVAVFGTAVQNEPNAIPKMFVAGIIPVTDYKTFISSNRSATKPDANGISTIGPMKFLVTQDANFAILTQPADYAALANAVKTAKTKKLSATLTAAQRDAAGKARIWAYGNVQQAQKLYGPMIVSKMEEAKKAMSAKDPNMAQFSQFMAVYVDLVKSLMNETKDITIAANPKADLLGLTGTLAAIPGTETAKTLTASAAAKGPNKLLGYAPDNAFETMAGKIDKPVIINMYSKFLDAMAPLFGPKFTADEKAKVSKLIADSVNPLGLNFMFSAATEPNSTPPFSAMYVFEVVDAEAFRKNINAWTEMIDAPYMQDLFKQLGFQITYKITQNAEQYNGVAIDEAKMTMKSYDPNSMMSQMIVKVYGHALTYKMATVNGLALWTMGTGADAKIKALIDKTKAGEPNAVNSEFKNAMALLPDSNTAQFVGTYNYLRVLQLSAGFMPVVPSNTASLQNFTSKSNIAFGGNIGNGDIAFSIVVPKQHILEIKSAFETFMPKQAKSCRP